MLLWLASCVTLNASPVINTTNWVWDMFLSSNLKKAVTNFLESPKWTENWQCHFLSVGCDSVYYSCLIFMFVELWVSIWEGCVLSFCGANRLPAYYHPPWHAVSLLYPSGHAPLVLTSWHGDWPQQVENSCLWLRHQSPSQEWWDGGRRGCWQ